jgi:hypothetical protein
MIHRTQQALLDDAVPSSRAMDTLLQDLAQARARKRLRGRPFVTLSYAQSVDGSIAIARGLRSALSGPESLRFTHALRAGHDGILVGVGTVLADDPELRVRLVDGRDPQPVIVDSSRRRSRPSCSRSRDDGPGSGPPAATAASPSRSGARDSSSPSRRPTGGSIWTRCCASCTRPASST